MPSTYFSEPRGRCYILSLGRLELHIVAFFMFIAFRVYIHA
ncbi:hypothetical protein HanIR_Chr05g0213711 [Helianthus annuus]|nr:hypothetical protein HanIR_Chr05g0213711 [Helianthus annuus]